MKVLRKGGGSAGALGRGARSSGSRASGRGAHAEHPVELLLAAGRVVDQAAVVLAPPLGRRDGHVATVTDLASFHSG